MRDVWLHTQKRGWARDVMWIAGRGCSPDKSSSRRWNVSDGGREDDGAGVPRRPADVVVPGEFCVIKNRLRAKFK